MAKKRAHFHVPHTRRQSRITFVARPTSRTPEPQEPWFSGTMKARGDLNIECGGCGALIVDGGWAEEVRAQWFDCPQCEETLSLDLEQVKRELDEPDA